MEKQKFLKDFFGYGSPIVMIVSFSMYLVSIITSLTQTNLTVWIVWSIISFANTFSYYYSVEKDYKKTLICFVSSAFNIAILITAFVCSAVLKPLASKDYLAIGITITALVAWKFSNARNGQIIIISAVLVGFLALWSDMISGNAVENSFIWFGYSIAILFQVIFIILTWDDEKEHQQSEYPKGVWIRILGPVSYLWMHAFTMFLAIFKM